MKIKPGIYLDSLTGEEVEVMIITKVSKILTLNHRTGIRKELSASEFENRFISVETMNEASKMLFDEE